MSTIRTENGLRIQTAESGKVLKSGNDYTPKVFLGEGAAEWEEVNEEEAQAALKIPINEINSETLY